MRIQRDLREEEILFLNWLIDNDMNPKSELYCVLTVEKYMFIKSTVLIHNFIDEDEANQLNEIIQNLPKRTKKLWKKYKDNNFEDNSDT